MKNRNPPRKFFGWVKIYRNKQMAIRYSGKKQFFQPAMPFMMVAIIGRDCGFQINFGNN